LGIYSFTGTQINTNWSYQAI